MIVSLFSAVVCLYIVLSNNTTGVVGLVINGKSRGSEFVLADGPVELTLPRTGSGLIYPLVVVCNRRSLVMLMRVVVSPDSLNFTGIVVLGLEIVSSTPQFFVLTRYVACQRVEPSRPTLQPITNKHLPHSPFARPIFPSPHSFCCLNESRIDDTAQFFGSAVACCITEVCGGVVAARAAKRQLELTRLEPDSHCLSSCRFAQCARASAAVQPDAPVRADERADEQDKAQFFKLLLAFKVAHQELGEKTGMILGVSVAAWFEGVDRAGYTAVKGIVLVLLETGADLVREAVYAVHEIQVGRVRYTLDRFILFGVALAGLCGCGCLFQSVRSDCMFGLAMLDALG
jgi:hypothetical protein